MTKKKFEKLIDVLRQMARTDDSIRIYKLRGYGEVTVLGEGKYLNGEDFMII